MIPTGDLSRCYERHRAELDAAVADVMSGGCFVLGDRLRQFEDEFAAYLGVSHVVGVGNGTDAVALILRGLGIGPGDEVVTTPLSAAFTALAISQAGATPVFADVDSQSLTLDPVRIIEAITPRTRAILPVHLYGQPAEMDGILAVAGRRGLPVIEDCAQAHGAKYGSVRAGALGRAAAFSFYPSKNLGAFGDGGAIATDDPDLADSVRRLRDGGRSSRDVHVEAGVNSRLDELQAAVLSVRLGHLDGDNERRRAIAARYDEALAGQDVVKPPVVAPKAEHVFHQYVVRHADRDTLAQRLAQADIGSAVHYPTPIHMQPAYGGPDRAGEYPAAERACMEVLSVPIFPELTDDEVETVVAALAGAVEPPVEQSDA